eukprot:7618331-Pyramimonas_sp.AAC.1
MLAHESLCTAYSGLLLRRIAQTIATAHRQAVQKNIAAGQATQESLRCHWLIDHALLRTSGIQSARGQAAALPLRGLAVGFFLVADGSVA